MVCSSTGPKWEIGGEPGEVSWRTTSRFPESPPQGSSGPCFWGILQLNPIFCRRLPQEAGLCLQHSAGMRRDSGPVTMSFLEEVLVLFWLLSVFLRCPGQQSGLPEGAFALARLT